MKLFNPPNCSVVQGFKLSWILYTQYKNEAPVLHKFLGDRDWMTMNFYEEITNYSWIKHMNVNFLDVSNSVVSFVDPCDAITLSDTLRP